MATGNSLFDGTILRFRASGSTWQASQCGFDFEKAAGQRNDVMVFDLAEVPAALTADADRCDVQFFAGWRLAGATQAMAGYNANGGGADACGE
ncbi:MAG: hypothetical protein ABSG53_32800 [Thermoguttaceae bacterium]